MRGRNTHEGGDDVDLALFFEAGLKRKLFNPAKTRRRDHHDVIVAWLGGADVQCKTRNGTSWWDTTAPDFCNQQMTFRVKPEEDDEKVQLKRDIEKLELHLKNLKERL